MRESADRKSAEHAKVRIEAGVQSVDHLTGNPLPLRCDVKLDARLTSRFAS